MNEVKTPEQIIQSILGKEVDWFDDSIKFAARVARTYASQLSPDQIVRERLEGMLRKHKQLADSTTQKGQQRELDMFAVNAIELTLSLLSEAPPVSKWVKVEDGLPKLTEPTYWYNDAGEREVWEGNKVATVLAYDVEHGIYKAVLDRSGWTEVSSNSIRGAKPTHWQPLPTPPKD